MNCWAVLEMTVSLLPCAKISPAERTESNEHCVALICVFLSYCCKNTSLTINGLKQYSVFFFFKLGDSTSRPEWLTPLAQFIQSNSNWLLAGLLWRTLRSSCHYIDSNGKQNPTSWNWKALPFPRFQQDWEFYFSLTSLHPCTTLCFLEAAIACSPSRLESPVFSSTTPVWLKLSSTPLFSSKASYDYTAPIAEPSLLHFKTN